MLRTFIASLTVIGTTSVLFAAEEFTGLRSLIENFTQNVVATLGYLALTAGVVAFFFGMIQFIWASREGDGAKMEKGKGFMIWGLVGLFVMFSVWGIITFAQKALGPNFQQTDILLPKIRFSTTGSSPTPGPLTPNNPTPNNPTPNNPTPGVQPRNGDQCSMWDVGDNAGLSYEGACYPKCANSSLGATCVTTGGELGTCQANNACSARRGQ